MSEDFVDYKILIDAVRAVETLRELALNAITFKERLDLATASVRKFSEETGMSLRNTAKAFESLDRGIAESTKTSTVFGSESKAGWNQAGQAAKEGTSSIFNSLSLLRSAFHVLVIGGIFEIINAFRQMFTEALDGLKKMEVSVYNLANAEKALSQSGMEITFKDLESIVDRLHKKFDGLFSKVNLQDMVADVAIATKELGLSAEQIEKISASAAALQLRNPEKTLGDVSKQLLTAILSGQTKGIRSLGVAASEAAIQQEALALGLIKVGETATAQQKSLATLELVYQATVGDAKNLAQYENTLTGVQQQLKSTWQDFLAEAAKDFAPLLIQGLKMLINTLQILSKVFEVMAPHIQRAAIMLASFVAAFKGLGGLNPIAAIKKFGDQFKQAAKDYTDYFNSFNNSLDTPTGAIGIAAFNDKMSKAVQESGDKLATIFQDNKDKLLDIESKYQDKLQDLARKNAEKLADISRNDARKREDALSDLNKKVTDINTDINQKEVDAKKEAHRKEIDEEQKYQQALKELQQKYLMDLEDALHNRDAKQILHLMRQYAFDKQNLADKHKQDQQASKVELAQKLQDLEIERKQKIAAAQKEYADKLKELDLALRRERQDAAIAHQRDLMDARIAHERDLAEQRLYLQRKLRDLATALMQEYSLTKTMVEAIFKLWAAKYGTSLPSFSISSPTPTTSTAAGSFSSFAATQAAVTGGMGYGLANGGSFLATTPTKINVAESGPELVSATPLGRVGSDLNKLFMQAGGVRGDRTSGGGQFELGVTLSQDLETRIIKKSLDETANVVMRVQRGKV